MVAVELKWPTRSIARIGLAPQSVGEHRRHQLVDASEFSTFQSGIFYR